MHARLLGIICIRSGEKVVSNQKKSTSEKLEAQKEAKRSLEKKAEINSGKKHENLFAVLGL